MGDYFAHSKSVLFESGHVLTKGMLVESYAYPRTLMRILTNRLDDCIIAGFQFDVRNNDVFILPGCFKSRGEIYLFESEVNLQELWNHFKNRGGKPISGGGDIVYLKFSSDDVNDDKSYQDVIDRVMKLEFASKFSDEDFVIGRLQFINDCVKLPDRVSALDDGSYLGLLDVKYWYNDAITFHPEVFRCIISDLNKKENKDYFDWLLLMLLSSKGIAKKDVLFNYVMRKGMKMVNGVDNWELCRNIKIAIKKNIECSRQSSEFLSEKPKYPINGGGSKIF